MAIKDITGIRSGLLTALCFHSLSKPFERSPKNCAMWVCECDCGKQVIKAGHLLSKGSLKSCGCLRNPGNPLRKTKHGATRRHRPTQEYRAWAAMKNRCRNPSHKDYERYGGRGISVCNRWEESFTNFLLDMGPRPGPGYSIDRINVDGNYELSNCRWATIKEQLCNRSNTLRDSDGTTLIQLSEDLGIRLNTLSERWRRGDRGEHLRRPTRNWGRPIKSRVPK